MSNTSNKRIQEIRPVESPAEVLQKIPSTSRTEKLVTATRDRISNILHKKDKRLLVVVGPCSIHDVNAAMEYGERLAKLREQYKDRLEIVMRVYFEKPRTTVGWKGLINDPDLDESFNINKGLELARQLLVDINGLGVPAGSEFLDIVTGQYYAGLVSWGAIGARTTESQVHRELASGLSCPIGFKNGTDGNTKIAIDAIRSSNEPHIFLSPTDSGKTGIFKTTGNNDAHIILRGGRTPNYDSISVKTVLEELQDRSVDTNLIIDCSHANSEKKYERQNIVVNEIAKQIELGQTGIGGVMIESHLVEGRQNVDLGKPLVYGQSITDACLGWSDTESALAVLASAVDKRF
ncbi:MAG: 3-deoxy-7-phosphoheptulonate synthase [Agarilytica sp.]